MSADKRFDLDVTSLRVILHGDEAGALALTKDGLCAFQYSKGWIRNGFSISPFSLPLSDKVHVAKPSPLDGVFGVFDDSLPDGWGRLLVDRILRQHGIDPMSVSMLARLAIVGKSGMGALEYEPEMTFAPAVSCEDLDAIADECARVLNSDYSDDLDALFALGGSSGGARPKILTTINNEEWIVKFPSSHDPKDIGVHEFAIAQAAKKCGVEMAPVRLLPSKQCGGYFATRRFDRPKDQYGNMAKTHMASAAALLETSHRIPNLDYDLLMRLTMKLTSDIEEIERLYRLMAFNVFIGNKDDHSKNFTFLHVLSCDTWTLSPAYDLTHNAGINGEHATTVNGKGRDISRDDIIAVGKRAGISASKCSSICNEVQEAAYSALREIEEN